MLLIGGGRLITRDAAQPYLSDGCVVTDGGLIREIGPTSAMRAKYPDAENLDARGGVIMPGLINAHNHIYSATCCWRTRAQARTAFLSNAWKTA